jgi:curved DNA-binding protein CbpA
MSSTLISYDPYAVLGVDRGADVAEIKAAHRKLVLLCHPDKVKDESQLARAQEQFQRVHESYALLSDENKRLRHDQEVKLAELRKEAKERSLGRGSSSFSSREYRDGHIYEERTPSGAYADEELALSDEQRSSSRKYDDYGKRPRSKGMDEKKRSKGVPVKVGTPHDSPKTTRHRHAKLWTKERRRESSARVESATRYCESDDECYSSDSSYRRSARHTSEGKRSRESLPRKTKRESSRNREFFESKEDYQQLSAQEHIRRSKASPQIGVDRPTHITQSPERYDGYESSDGVGRRPRHPRRPHPKMDSPRQVSPPRPHRSYEHFDRMGIPTANSAPSGIKMPAVSRPVPHQTRSPTSGSYSKSKSTSTRYFIVEEPEMIEIKPEPRRHKSYSPERPPPSPRAGSRSAKTYYPSHENARPSTSRSSTSRPLFGEVRHKESEPRYREIRPDHVPHPRDAYMRSCDERHRHPTLGRRQSAQA